MSGHLTCCYWAASSLSMTNWNSTLPFTIKVQFYLFRVFKVHLCEVRSLPSTECHLLIPSQPQMSQMTHDCSGDFLLFTSRNRCLECWSLLLSPLTGYWSTLQVYLPRPTAAAGHYQGQSSVSCITPELVTVVTLATLATLVTTLWPVSPWCTADTATPAQPRPTLHTTTLLSVAPRLGECSQCSSGIYIIT